MTKIGAEIDIETDALLDRYAAKLNLNKSDVIILAIKRFTKELKKELEEKNDG